MPTTADAAHGSRALFGSRITLAAPEVLRYGQECAAANEMRTTWRQKCTCSSPGEAYSGQTTDLFFIKTEHAMRRDVRSVITHGDWVRLPEGRHSYMLLWYKALTSGGMYASHRLITYRLADPRVQ